MCASLSSRLHGQTVLVHACIEPKSLNGTYEPLESSPLPTFLATQEIFASTHEDGAITTIDHQCWRHFLFMYPPHSRQLHQTSSGVYPCIDPRRPISARHARFLILTEFHRGVGAFFAYNSRRQGYITTIDQNVLGIYCVMCPWAPDNNV